MTIKIITGMAGGGKSTVLDSFEDMGYYCIDNMPPSLLAEFIHLYERMGLEKQLMAICMDLRLGVFFDEVPSTLKKLREEGYDIEIIFVEASDSVLLKRYIEVRRTHPLETAGRTSEAIRRERELLSGIREKSDYIIDTSSLTGHQLKRKLIRRYGSKMDFQVILESYGMKYGNLENADITYDLRFLPNPYYVESLKRLTGHDEEVRNFIMENQVAQETFLHLSRLLKFTAEQFKKSGRENIHIGLACTGGKHRSVTFSLLLEDFFKELGYEVIRQDRELR